MELVLAISSITNQLSVIYRMPPVKSKNGLNQGTFCNEFNDYLKKLSCMNGDIVIIGDLTIDWLNTNGSERKPFCNILEIYVQKHTEAIIYLTILSLERIVILYQTPPSQTLFPIIEHFTLHCNVYVPTQFGNR